MAEGAISANVLFALPLTSPPAPSPFRIMFSISLLVAVRFVAVPAVPELPLLVEIAPAVVVPFVVLVGFTGSHTEYVPAGKLANK